MGADDIDELKRRLNSAHHTEKDEGPIPSYRKKELKRIYYWRDLPTQAKTGKQEARLEIAEEKVRNAHSKGELTDDDLSFLLDWYDEERDKIQGVSKEARMRGREKAAAQDILGDNEPLGHELPRQAGDGMTALVETPAGPPQGPFSLSQAEMIQDNAYCPYCGWRRGEQHPILNKPLCVHQILAGEVIKGHRRAAENNVTFTRASEVRA